MENIHCHLMVPNPMVCFEIGHPIQPIHYSGRSGHPSILIRVIGVIRGQFNAHEFAR